MDKKVCAKCKKDLPATTEFFASRTDRRTFTFQSFCKECQKQYRRQHYLDNKEKYIKKARGYNKKVGDWFEELKKTLFCKICGENRSWVLDFHHLDPKQKDKSLAQLKNKGSKKKISEEMKKCIVLCSNCHRDLHYKEKQI